MLTQVYKIAYFERKCLIDIGILKTIPYFLETLSGHGISVCWNMQRYDEGFTHQEIGDKH